MIEILPLLLPAQHTRLAPCEVARLSTWAMRLALSDPLARTTPVGSLRYCAVESRLDAIFTHYIV